jgi:hypothetical protein
VRERGEPIVDLADQFVTSGRGDDGGHEHEDHGDERHPDEQASAQAHWCSMASLDAERVADAAQRVDQFRLDVIDLAA